MLVSMGLQRVRHDLATEQQQTSCPKTDRNRHSIYRKQLSLPQAKKKKKKEQCSNLRLKAEIKRSPYAAQGVKFPFLMQTELINLYLCFRFFF